MKIYQLSDDLKRKYYKIDLKGVKNDKELVKTIIKNWRLFTSDRVLNNIAIYVENIPKKVCNYKELTIVLDLDSGEVRYFSSLCS